MVNPRCTYIFAIKKQNGVVVEIGKGAIGGRYAGGKCTDGKVPASCGKVQTASEKEEF